MGVCVCVLYTRTHSIRHTIWKSKVRQRPRKIRVYVVISRIAVHGFRGCWFSHGRRFGVDKLNQFLKSIRLDTT